METHCLNCNEYVNNKFCPNCGQKSNTHRITFFRFISHDLLHGTFHLERGIIYTLKEALIRPGRAALDYISGKRIRYYNVFYLSLILIGVAILLNQTGSNQDTLKGEDKESERFVAFLTNNIKIIVLCFVPLLAVNARVLFWKCRLNLAEHFIVAGFAFVGMLLIIDVTLTVMLFEELTHGSIVMNWIHFIMSSFAVLFPLWAYGNLAWKTHSIIGLLWRMIIFYALLIIEIFTLTLLAIWMVTGNTEISIG